MRKLRSFGFLLALSAVVGLAVRLWNIGGEPLWLDEAYSAYAADHDWAFLLHVVPRYETHPPFYYSLLHLWVQAFGNTLISLRLPGLLAGIAAPPMVALAAREAGAWLGWGLAQRRRLCLAAFSLACLSTVMVEMTRQVRPYPLMILAYAAALTLLLRLARLRAAGRPIVGRAFAAYFLLVEAMLWLHNLGPLYACALTLALAVALLGRRQRHADLGWLTAAHIIVVLLYLPGLAILRDQVPTWAAHTWLHFRLDKAFFDHLTMLFAAPGVAGFALFPLLGLALAALLRGGGTERRLAAILLILAVLPVMLAVVLSLTIAPVFITRTMSPVAAPAMLLLAVGATAWPGTKRIIGVGAALLLGAAMLAANIQARMAGPMQDWYRTVDWLAARFEPGDQIFAYPNEGALPLSYALRDRALPFPVRPIPTAVPSFATDGGWYPTGSRGVVSLQRDRLRAIALAPETRAVPTIWLLRLSAETYDPDNVFLQELHRGRYIVRSWRDGPIDIIGLRRRPAPARNRR